MPPDPMTPTDPAPLTVTEHKTVTREDTLVAALADELVRVVRMESGRRVLNLSVEDRARRWAIGIAQRLLDTLDARERDVEWFECDVPGPHQHQNPWSTHEGPHPMNGGRLAALSETSHD